MEHITFASPWAFVLLVVPVLMLAWRIWKRKQLYPTLRIPTLAGVQSQTSPLRGIIKQNLFVLRVLALIALIVALARPQTPFSEEEISTEGIDIVMALDVSGSMLARDFSPDRLGAAKKVAADFVSDRPNDRIGLVVFAGESFTQCPITTDTNVVKKMIQDVQQGLIEDGTAIGMGLATAVNRLKESEAKSRVIILMTDGVNNSGAIDPRTAIEAALQYRIRVYTIGVGSKGMAPFPAMDPFGRTTYVNMEVEIDEELLEEIAEETGGQYFRATDNQTLRNVYEQIDQLEKSIIQQTRISRTKEEFHPFLLLGLGLLLLELLLRYLVVRSWP